MTIILLLTEPWWLNWLAYHSKVGKFVQQGEGLNLATSVHFFVCKLSGKNKAIQSCLMTILFFQFENDINPESSQNQGGVQRQIADEGARRPKP